MDAEKKKEQATYLDRVSSIRADIISWVHAVIRNAIYDEGDRPSCPQSFSIWFTGVQKDGVLDTQRLKKMESLHNNVREAADKFSDDTSDKALYDTFADLSENFISDIRQLEQDTVLEMHGIDPLTGLRSRTFLEADIRKELERVARHGQPFTMALVQIDDYEEISASLNSEELKEHIRTVSDLIKESLRSFDDGYRYKEGQFVLTLKQAETSGGIIALERLKAGLEDKNITIKVNGQKNPLTLSCCATEPVPEDDVKELLDGLSSDLRDMSGRTGAVFEYYEISPLERYVKDKQEQG